jgi:hypothetical protein
MTRALLNKRLQVINLLIVMVFHRAAGGPQVSWPMSFVVESRSKGLRGLTRLHMQSLGGTRLVHSMGG